MRSGRESNVRFGESHLQKLSSVSLPLQHTSRLTPAPLLRKGSRYFFEDLSPRLYQTPLLAFPAPLFLGV